MKFTVDPPELHTAATKLRDLAGDYTNVYNRLLNAASTMGEAYNSADNLAFVEQINGFCEELKAMADHMETASLAMDQQAKNYEEVRDTNVTVVKQLAN